MIQFKSDHGDITVSSAVFSNITGMAATNAVAPRTGNVSAWCICCAGRP